MKVQVVYTTHCKDAKLLAEDIARYARTYARPTTEFNFDEDIDLLVLGFEEYPCVKDKELEEFICRLSRQLDCLPGKESLEKSCSLFMSKVLQAKEKADVAASTKDKLNR